MSKKVVMLIGSEGYIGRNFQERYKDEYTFLCSDYHLDNAITKVEDIAYIYDNFFADHSGSEKLEAIINLAAISGIKNCDDSPSVALHSNAFLPIAVYEFMKAYPHVTKDTINIFASSQAVKNPVNFYSQTKLIGEYWTHKCNKGVSLRLANVFGGMYYTALKNSVVAQFLKALKKNQPPVIHGTGEQKRDFIHVFDVCEALHLAIEKKSNLINQAYEIGTGVSISILDLAKKMMHGTDVSQVILDLDKDMGVSGNEADYAGFSGATEWFYKYPIWQKESRNL